MAALTATVSHNLLSSSKMEQLQLPYSMMARDAAPRSSSRSISASTQTAASYNTATNLINEVCTFAHSYSDLTELFEKTLCPPKSKKNKNKKNQQQQQGQQKQNQQEQSQQKQGNQNAPNKSSSTPPATSIRSFQTEPPRSSSSSTSFSSGSGSLRREYTRGPEFHDAYQKYSRTAHMGILDPSYETFTSERGYGALVYKVRNRTAVITGDPLCPADQFPLLLKEFRAKRKLKLAFMGVGREFAEYANSKSWTTMVFGRERVLNPLTNKVLHQVAGKRMMAQSRRLLDPKRVGLTADLYSPGTMGRNPNLEMEIQQLYDEWRDERNARFEDSAQAFVTEYDLFSDPDITLYAYTRDREGQMVGLAVLRSLGASCGFHLDPCIASPTAPSGVTDLLVILSMMLLRGAGLAYLSFGYEPSPALGEISGQWEFQASMTRWGYKRVIDSLHVGGKAGYHDKFHPDEALTSNLYIVVPRGPLQLVQSAALMHVANIKLRRVFATNNRRKEEVTQASDDANKEAEVTSTTVAATTKT